jgi:TRAP-type C4-dicarboxylate transport system substrate-binding protein
MQKQTILSYIGLGIIVIFFVGIFSFNPFSETKGTASSEEISVRWLLAHEPTDLFINATEIFTKILDEESDGTMKLTVLTPSDVGFGNDGATDVPTSEVFKLLNDQKIEMGTTFATGVGKEVPQFLEVNLPFLFDDLPTALAILDDVKGQELLNSVSKQTDTTALAFTLSGGFRILASQKDLTIHSADDLKGKTVLTSAGSPGEETFRQLGASSLTNSNDVAHANGVDFVETTYTRISALKDFNFIKYVNETNHSLFLTTIVVRNSFYNSLSEKNQIALKKAALAAAQAERVDSIALGIKVKKELQEKGIVVRELSPETRTELKEKTLPVYTWFEDTIGTRIIK